MRFPATTLFFMLVASGPAFTQGGTPFIVKDFNQNPVQDRLGSRPEFWCKLSGRVLFAATTFEQGRELFVTQGTATSTKLVADLRLGAKGSDPVFLGKIGKGVLFAADDGWHGREIWITDGTTLGTHLLAETQTGPGSSFLGSLGQVGSLVFFQTKGAGGRKTLWRSDGTTKGTFALFQVQPLPPRVEARIFPPVPTKAGILVWANDGTNTGFYLTDGSPGGTKRFLTLKSILIFSMASNGKVALFLNGDSKNGYEVWSSDGTAKGTRLLRDLLPGPGSSAPSQFQAWQGKILFLAKGPGQRLPSPWISDGTAQGTKALLGSTEIRRIQTAGNIAFFQPFSNPKDNRPWFLLPGGKPKKVLLGLAPWTKTLFFPTLVPKGFVVFTYDQKFQTWAVDLQSGKGTPLAPLGFYPVGKGLFDGSLAYLGLVNPLEGSAAQSGEPYTLDGTLKGTRLLKNLYRLPATGSSDSVMSFPSGRKNLVAAMSYENKGGGFFEWAGLPPAPRFLRKLDFLSHLSNVEGKLQRSPDVSYGFFNGASQLFRLDESFDGKTPLTLWGTVLPLPGTGSLSALLGHKLLFPYTKSVFTGNELFLNDGTPKGTGLLKDLLPGRESSMPQFFRRIGNLVFFSARDPKGKRRPWKSDGSATGTQALSFAQASLVCSDPREFRTWDQRVWFIARDSKTGAFLPYFTQKKGTQIQGRVQDSGWGAGFQSLSIKGVGPFRLILAGILKKGKTERHFALLKQPNGYRVQALGAFSSSLFQMQAALPHQGSFLFFGIQGTGREAGIWKGDGSAQGTRRIFKMTLPPLSGLALNPMALGSRRALFMVDGGLWQTDGTAQGTFPIHKRGLFKNPQALFLANGFLQFNAQDLLHGKEPWAWFPGAHGEIWGQGCGGTPIQNPSLVAEDPVLGKSFVVKGEGTGANAPGLVLLGVAGSPSLVLPSQTSIPCRLYLDVRSFWIPLAPFVSSGSGSWSQRYSAPGDLGLQGTSFVLQALFPKGGQGKLLFELSNGFQATLGR